MNNVSELLCLFHAALKTSADVVIYERRMLGARGALIGWAAVGGRTVTELKVGRGTAYQVEFADGGGITVHVREHDVVIGAAS